ncbi:MAG: PTS IIA-like nitrogen regulatory protein PtsN [Xanthomonadales bacterium]|nr:PTS IIA-like nitrogen regulatory protein PtsN [Xanthomonadales bacterium]
MFVSDLLTPERIYPKVRSSSKKRLLEMISTALSRNSASLEDREVFDSLCSRERLGSTGLGKGVAIPHARVSGCSAPQAVFLRLARPLAFDAADGKPVDLVFVLAVPESCTDDHLKLIAQIAELFSDPDLLERLREAPDSSALLQLLSTAKH